MVARGPEASQPGKHCGDLGRVGFGGARADAHDQLAETVRGEALCLPEQRLDVGVEELDRATYLGGVAADGVAVPVQDARESDRLRDLSGGEVPDVCMLRDDSERLALSRTPDPD